MLLEDRIRKLPCWNGALTLAPLDGGLSNANYLAADANGKHVVRFGEDFPFHHVSRRHELMVARAAHAAGLAPQVEYAADGVVVTRYLNARTFTAADVRQNAHRVASLIHRFHVVVAPHMAGPAQAFWVFHVIRDYARTLKAHDSPHAALLGDMLAQAKAFEAVQVPLPIVSAHNDLLPANILDDGDQLWLIDFEYAGFGTAMFDLAGVCSNAGFDSDEEQAFLEAYLGAAPDAAFRRSFSAMVCASLMRETLWATVSGLFLAAPGVDYGAYAEANLSSYRAAAARYQSAYGTILP
jgi:thiamine kinase-like enzyme